MIRKRTVDLTVSTLTGIEQEIAGQRQQGEGNRFSRAKNKALQRTGTLYFATVLLI